MKHNWEKDENGNVNEWAWESGFHNGVFCVDCGKSVCVHCDPDYMELDDCTGPEPGIDAATALSTLQAENEKMRAELEQVKQERDEAVQCIRGIAKSGRVWMCPYCVHAKDTTGGIAECELDVGVCMMPYSKFEWRGLHKEE